MRAAGRDLHPGPAAGEVQTLRVGLRRAGRAGHAHREPVGLLAGRLVPGVLLRAAALPGQEAFHLDVKAGVLCQTSSSRITPSPRPMTRPTCTSSSGGCQLPSSRLAQRTSWPQSGQRAAISGPRWPGLPGGDRCIAASCPRSTQRSHSTTAGGVRGGRPSVLSLATSGTRTRLAVVWMEQSTAPPGFWWTAPRTSVRRESVDQQCPKVPKHKRSSPRRGAAGCL